LVWFPTSVWIISNQMFLPFTFGFIFFQSGALKTVAVFSWMLGVLGTLPAIFL
jgi:hypothetical protein